MQSGRSTKTAGFDYVVIGAGSAGAAIAARLSEPPSSGVLLCEAGPDYRSADTPQAVRGPNYFKVFESTAHYWPDVEASLTEAQSPRLYPRGRGVGGSSAINAQGAMRGLPDDFDGWRDRGCRGWGWRDVLPDFIALETDLDFGDRDYHGQSGPIPICRWRKVDWGAVSAAFAQAAVDLGHPWHDDLNAPDHRGVSPAPWHRSVGGRVSSNDAYIEPARDRPNLEVRGQTQVDSVRISGHRAVGVWLEASGKRTFIEAGEVILTAGTIHSPAILMRSGIGPADSMRALGVDIVADLPGVGANLHDHPIAVLPIELHPEHRPATTNVPIDGCVLRWQIVALGDSSICPLDILRADTHQGGLMVALMQPASRGRLTLRSPDFNQPPRVEFRMLSDAGDRARLRTATRHALQMLDHPSLRRIGDVDARIRDLADSELDAWLAASCNAFSHAAGTCRMGRFDDPLAVVDSDCRVIGIDGLRVADASIMPVLPRAAPHLSVTMIAEHLAHRIAPGLIRADSYKGGRKFRHTASESVRDPREGTRDVRA